MARLPRLSARWPFAAGLALSAAVAGLCRGQAAAREQGSPVVLASTFEHILHSKTTGRDYVIWVALPPSYRQTAGSSGKAYPTLYTLDGRQGLQLSLPMLQLTNRGQSGDVILVGVGYPLTERGPYCGPVLCREIDYTPAPFPASDSIGAMILRRQPHMGGAAAFLSVLRDEVIPFVAGHYRVTEDRGLLGYSFGGLFSMFALFEDPEVFTRYAAVSPAIYYNPDMMLRREAALRARSSSLQKRVFLSVGSAEAPYAIADTWRLIGALCDGLARGDRYRGLELFAATNPGEGHASPVHFARALEALYPASDSGRRLSTGIRTLTPECTPP